MTEDAFELGLDYLLALSKGPIRHEVYLPVINLKAIGNTGTMSHDSHSYFVEKLKDAENYAVNSFKADEILALQALVQGEITVEETSQYITHNTSIASDAVEVESCLSDTFCFLNDAAVNLPLHQQTVIALLLSIRSLPDLKIPEDVIGRMPVKQGDVFKLLPSWASNWDYQLNHIFYVTHVKKFARTKNERNGKDWYAATSFTAQLISEMHPLLNCEGYWLMICFDAIVLALEYDAVDLDISIPATANWFLFAGKIIYQQVCKDRRYQEGALGFKDVYTGKFMYPGRWQGEARLSIGRWVFWRNRFTEVSNGRKGRETTRTMAMETAREMLKIETEK
ncbi:hypothetical protein B0O99DRAFT_592759 [Bisporella sp. PMI_857]|nr:hypothetical protein B0O99DRAFT_592759 [Bisporella sp. PMI_857]